LELLRIISDNTAIFDVRIRKNQKSFIYLPLSFCGVYFNRSRRGNHQMKKAVPLFGLIVFLMLILSLLASVASAQDIIIDTEKGVPGFRTEPARDLPANWLYVQDHPDTSADGWFDTNAYPPERGNGSFWYTISFPDMGKCKGIWETSVPYTGKYEVSAWIPSPDSFDPYLDESTPPSDYLPTKRAQYKVFHNDGVATATIDQNVNMGGFTSLGVFEFDSTARVELSSNGVEFWRCVAFDAVKFVPVDVIESPTLGNEFSSSNVWYVPDDYLTIQQAVDNATAGDTIIVRDGVYTENVNVDKRLTIQSENGSDSTIVQAADINDHVFEITADSVNISGFTVKDAAGYLSDGIRLDNAHHCNLSDNNVSNNFNGIFLDLSGNNTLRNNIITENVVHNFGIRGSLSGTYVQDIDTSNLVDGKPIYYWIDEKDKHVPTDAGCVVIINSSNITIRDLTLKNNYDGVLLVNTIESKIENVTVSNCETGIHLEQSSKNEVINNNGSNNGYCIRLGNSDKNRLTNNVASNSSWGIALYYSSHNTIANSTLLDNYDGLHILGNNNEVVNNTASGNDHVGIFLYAGGTDDNTVISNYVSNNSCGISLGGSWMTGGPDRNVVERNIILDNSGGLHIGERADENNVKYNTISRNENGIHIVVSQDNQLTGNNISFSTGYGIELCRSSGNYLWMNTISSTTGTGISVWGVSDNNVIYMNNFENNTNDAYSREACYDIWNSTEEIHYNYDGKLFKGYLGNYWSEFTSTDNDTNGIWDTNYIINSDNKDYNPLVAHFEGYGFIYGIFPDYGYNVTKNQLVTVYGSGFTDGMVAELTKEGEENIVGEDTEVLSKTYFTTKFNLSGKEKGLWDVEVTLPGGEQGWLPNGFEILGVAGEGYLYQNITIEAGKSQEYAISVPETGNLFITLQKSTSWQGKLSLLYDGEEIASKSGFHDHILHVVDPEPGVYLINITAYGTGSGILTAGTSLPELPLGVWIVSTIYCCYGSVWYQVELPPDQDRLYLEAEALGDMDFFNVYFNQYGGSDRWVSTYGQTSINIPDPAPGTYIVEFIDTMRIGGYHWVSEDQEREVLIMADTTSSVEPPPGYLPVINSISPEKGGNNGFVTIELNGGWLDTNATVALLRSGYEDIAAQNVYGSIKGTALMAAFNLIGKEPGEWSLVVTNPDGRNATAPGSFTIEEGGESELWIEIVGRDKIRVGRPAKYILRYGNSGEINMPAPLFTISTSASFPAVSLSMQDRESEEETLTVLGKGSPGSLSILRPGSSHSITFYVKTQEPKENVMTQDTGDTFNLQVSVTSTNPVFEVRNLAKYWDAYCPAPGIPLRFIRVFPRGNSTYLGPLGYGWRHNYDVRLEVLSDGTVAMLRGDSHERLFLCNSDGTYTPLRGYTTLTRLDGFFLLKWKDGTVYRFRTDLRLDYIEDTNGNRISAVYNPDNQLIELQHSCGESFSLEYNEHDRISRLVDHTGRVTAYNYYGESGELLINATTPDGAVTTYEYTSTGEGYGLSTISYPEGMQQFFKYDINGRLSESYLDGEEELIRYTYDVLNKSTYISDAVGNTAVVHVDEFREITWLENPLGALMQYEYDEDLDLIRTTDPLSNTYNFSYDEQGNTVNITNPLKDELTMEYNLTYNKLTWLRDARGNEMSFGYDEHGNVLTITYPDTSAELMGYDSAGNLINVTTQKGDTIDYTYNSRGQLIRKDYPDGSWVAYYYDSAGNTVSATDENGRIELEYNTMNQLTKITYPTGHFFNYQYDDAWRLIRRVDQDGKALNYDYDAASRLVRIADESDSDIVRYEYDTVGRLSKKRLSNGAYTTYDYDAAGQIIRLINYNATGKVISRFDYTYDLAGNPVSVNTLEGTYEYEYDSIGQLTKVTYPDGHSVSYTYDAAGNRIRIVENGDTTAYTTNNMNQYTDVGGVSYTYDANGNLISKIEDGVTTTYEYDFENRLTRVTSPEGTWEYTYDALGNRAGMVQNGIEHTYLVDPMGFGDVVAEYDAAGSLIARYIHGFGLISRIDSSGDPYYYHFNPTGHTMEITDVDGIVVNSYKYSPFGIYREKDESIPNPFGYVGEFGVMDVGNGLNYMRMRYYQPDLGRFSSEEPLMIVGENGYTYVRNNPLTYIDPFGLQFFKHARRFFTEVVSGLLAGLMAKLGGVCGMDMPLSALSFVAEWEKENPGEVAVAIPHMRKWGLRGYTSLEKGRKYKEEYGGNWWDDDENERECKPFELVGSATPEDKYGPNGFDLPGTPEEDLKRFVPADQNYYYKIDFWNKENATAPACDVYVKDQLDTNLNWSTLSFAEIGFLNWTVELEPCQYFNIYVDTRPEMDLFVNVEGVFELQKGAINWTFRSLDPATLETPEDPMAGFLPPITEN
jgi:RHS repeat-associated protein